MTAGATRMMLKLAAVGILVAAGLRWWKLFGRGFTMDGVFLAASLTGLGLFWWFLALRAKGSEDCCEPEECCEPKE